jgi:hypothetical protein
LAVAAVNIAVLHSNIQQGLLSQRRVRHQEVNGTLHLRALAAIRTTVIDSSTEQGLLSQWRIRHQEVNDTLQLRSCSDKDHCDGQLH